MDAGKQKKSQRQIQIPDAQMFHAQATNSGVNYQIVSYRENTII